ncbi:MAG: 3-dehydroquinate synthase [Bryobacterales bacterium]|nr:3-dehydroquinate synthase [Bryobacterales bacterium]
MPTFEVVTPRERYPAVVERGALARIPQHLPPGAGKVFIVSNKDVWRHQGARIEACLPLAERIFLPGGEGQKRLAPLEAAAEEMVRRGADRSSVVVAFGGGIVNDMAGFLASMFMRGIPVLQVPTTLLAQVDAAVGGKTGVNLASGKNLIGAFHQPLAVLIDPAMLETLPEREYRAGLYEVIKCGVIRSPQLFHLLTEQAEQVLAREDAAVDAIVAESVRIKAEVVSADERESGLRKILNFGHTVGHALEAETAYTRFLHGEAVAFGMKAATHLARLAGTLEESAADRILRTIDLYGPIPPLDGIRAGALIPRLASDKKTIQGAVHFVLPTAVGAVKVASGIGAELVREAIEAALA